MIKKLILQIVAVVMTLTMFLSTPVLAHEEDEFEILPFTTTDFEYEFEPISATSTLDEQEAAIIGTAIALIGGIGLFVFLGITFISYIYGAWTLMVIAQKLGDTSSWMAWVPILNLYLGLKIAGMNPWLLLLMFVPFVNIVLAVVVVMNIAEKRGFSNWLGLLILVPVVNIILPGYLAFAEPSKS